MLTILALIVAADAETFNQQNQAGTRHLYAPTAIPMEQGTGYFSQKELVMSSVAYGGTENISVLGGTPLPITLWALSEGETDAMMAIGAVKVGYKVAPNVYVGGGLEAFGVAGELLRKQLVRGRRLFLLGREHDL
ncbi:MAG: hypothetical protein ACI8RZ_002508 [Myxococcota bacterium]|jgi:hypothetical protein